MSIVCYIFAVIYIIISQDITNTVLFWVILGGVNSINEKTENNKQEAAMTQRCKRAENCEALDKRDKLIGDIGSILDSGRTPVQIFQAVSEVMKAYEGYRLDKIQGRKK